MADDLPTPPTAAEAAAASAMEPIAAASPAARALPAGVVAPHNTPMAAGTPQGLTPANSFRVAPPAAAGSRGADTADVAAALSERLGRLGAGGSPTEIIDVDVGEDDDEDDELAMEVLPPVVRRRLRALRKLQEDREAIDDEYRRDRLELEARYRARVEPLHQQRADVVSGRVEPSDEDTKADDEEAEAALVAAASDEDGNIIGVPDFWLGVLTNSSDLSELIEEHDVDALHYLRDVRVIDADDMTGFRLEFHFAENPFFENEVLAKEYVVPNLMEGGQPYLEDMRGVEIRWKPGKDLSVKRKKTKQQGPDGKPRVKISPQNSFFNFFTPPPLEEMQALSREDAERFLMAIDQDVTAGVLLRERVVPNAVLWYTGEMGDDSDEESGSDEDDEDDFDEEDDESGSDDDDGRPFQPASFGSGAPGAAGAPENPECKQQ